MEPAELVGCVTSQLARAGIDCVTPLALGWYNDSIPEEIGARIPARGAAGQSALVVLIANSRAVWEPFLEACASQDLLQHDNPLDAYLEQHVCNSLAGCAPGLRPRIYWSSRETDELQARPNINPSKHVAFQRMAHHAGLAYLDETCHLCLHPRFGPWFSLRCALIFDDVPYNQPRPAELRNPLPAATRLYVKMALHTAVHNTSRKFSVPEVDVEAAEAVLAEASIEAVLEEDCEQEQELQAVAAAAEGMAGGSEGAVARQLLAQQASRPGSSARSLMGSEEAVCGSGGSTPAASSGCSSPQVRGQGAQATAAAAPGGPAEGQLATAAPVAVPGATGGAGGLRQSQRASSPAASCGSLSPGGSLGSPGVLGSLGSSGSRRSSSCMDAEAKPGMRAVSRNWRAWVAVRDSPCPGHPMRYSEEQIAYHYTRDRNILHKALLRRNLQGPGTPLRPATGLRDPALQAFHTATMEAHRRPLRSYVTPSPITAP